MKTTLSVIIPTLNEEKYLGRLLAILLRSIPAHQIIVSDGGSTDATVDIARAAQVLVTSAKGGRGPQLNAGAILAPTSVLLFLHADTLPAEDALAAVETTMQNSTVAGGTFTVSFSGHAPSARILEHWYRFVRLWNTSYGDSGLFVRATVFRDLGGFPDFPLFEDLVLYQNLRRAGTRIILPQRITTSTRRFEGRFMRTFALWTLLQTCYWLGVSPHHLAKFYTMAR